MQVMLSNRTVPTPIDRNYQKKLGIKVLEVLCQKYLRWTQGIDRRTDIILESDIGTLSNQELEIFYNLNDLHLDLKRILTNVTDARNTSTTTTDTEGTA